MWIEVLAGVLWISLCSAAMIALLVASLVRRHDNKRWFFDFKDDGDQDGDV
jgi:hypothetical protein